MLLQELPHTKLIGIQSYDKNVVHTCNFSGKSVTKLVQFCF